MLPAVAAPAPLARRSVGFCQPHHLKRGYPQGPAWRRTRSLRSQWGSCAACLTHGVSQRANANPFQSFQSFQSFVAFVPHDTPPAAPTGRPLPRAGMRPMTTRPPGWRWWTGCGRGGAKCRGSTIPRRSGLRALAGAARPAAAATLIDGDSWTASGEDQRVKLGWCFGSLLVRCRGRRHAASDRLIARTGAQPTRVFHRWLSAPPASFAAEPELRP